MNLELKHCLKLGILWEGGKEEGSNKKFLYLFQKNVLKIKEDTSNY